MRNRLLPALAALALAAARPAGAQTSLATYVAVGDSLTAGVVSGSLVLTHQANSFPAMIARQAGVTGFQQPTVSEPGAPPELILTALLPSPLIVSKAASPGSPTNFFLARPYNNLGIPGTTSVDCVNRTTDGGGAFDLILRGRGTQLQQAVSLRPTFLTLWIGPYDVLGGIVRGRAIDGVTLTPAPVFRQVYQQVVSTLKATGATIIAANIPDVTSIPFATTIPPVVVNAARQPVLVNGRPLPLIGPNGPLPSGSLVTLAASSFIAQGVGIPTSVGGQGTPLPDEVVLDPGEVAAIRDRVTVNNQAISDICQAAGVPVVDMNALLAEIATTGRTIGGITFTNAFLTGGIFSYDGVHPTELGYAIVANEWIRVINDRGGNLPLVDLGPFMGLVAQAPSARAESGPVLGAFSERPRPGAAPRLAPAVELTWEAYQNLLALFPPLGH